MTLLDCTKTMKPSIEQRVTNLETRNKALEDRVLTLEQEMTTCLSWMKIQAEREAEKADPTFKAKPGPTA